jgi:hypothetical protein
LSIVPIFLSKPLVEGSLLIGVEVEAKLETDSGSVDKGCLTLSRNRFDLSAFDLFTLTFDFLSCLIIAIFSKDIAENS